MTQIMSEKPASWIPNLGGWLSILNGLAFLCLVELSQMIERHQPVLFLTVCFFVLGFPCLWPFLLTPRLHGPCESDIVTAAVMVGVNSFCWGYGLAAILRWVDRKLRGQSPSSDAGHQSDAN